jgi:hypothetical protein
LYFRKAVSFWSAPALLLSFAMNDPSSLDGRNSLKLKHVAKARDVLTDDFIGSVCPIESGMVAQQHSGRVATENLRPVRGSVGAP